MRVKRNLVLMSLVVVLLVGGAPAATEARKDRPSTDFDENRSPLQKAVERTVEKKKEKMRNMPGAQGEACDAAIRNDNQANIQKFCEVPGLSLRKLGGGEIVNPQGKVVGRNIVTETMMKFDDPSQRDGEGTRWGPVNLRGARFGDLGGGTFNPGRQDPDDLRRNGAARRNAAMFPTMEENNDRDCHDRVTGEHFGGYLDPDLPAEPSNLIPDGDPRSCYDAAGQLKQTLSLRPAPETGCIHVSGVVLDGDPSDGLEDDCFDDAGNLRTSLEPAIDEDRPEELDNDADGLLNEDPQNGINDDNDCITVDGTILRDAACFDGAGNPLPDVRELIDEDDVDDIDDDADGRIDEDPAEFSHTAGCQEFYASVGLMARPDELFDSEGEEQCDLTRAMVVAVNEQSMAAYNGKKFFQADDDGDPDTSVLDDLDGDGQADSVEIGAEKRHVRLVEDFKVRCPKGEELVGGQCVAPPSTERGAESLANLVPAAALRSLEAGESGTVEKYALMGFTFAPPVLEWGYRVQEEACVDVGFGSICWEVFFARIGYEFDIRAGMRLPARVTVQGVPTQPALAGTDVSLAAAIEPVDFTARQFEDICIENDLDDAFSVSDCKRFSFPDFFDAVNPLVPDDEKDGDELVAGYDIFAGVIVRVLGIPVIRWGLDASDDLMTMCTMQQILAKAENISLLDLMNLGQSLSQDRSLARAIKDQGANCASFTTPFGLEADPLNPLVDQLRAFPFTGSYDVRADCAEAFVRGEVINVKGKMYPICTNLILGASGASLGIGLGVEFSAGSNLITADWTVAEDVDPAADDAGNQLRFRHDLASGDPDVTVAGPLRVDNFDSTEFRDTARVQIDDFTYNLNAFQMSLKANLQFGGILTLIPDIGSFTLFNFILDAGDYGIPIAQHAGMDPIDVAFPVENHGLSVDVSPIPSDPSLLVDDDTQQIAPGEVGEYQVAVRNLGSIPGDFDNFRVELSNRPGQSAPFTFLVNPNTDFDCVDAGGAHFTGDPYDGVADDCYDASGQARTDRTELIDEDPPGPAGGSLAERDEDGDGIADEDPPDVWMTLPDPATFQTRIIQGVPPYTDSTPAPGQSLVLGLRPFQHPLTKPGLYPFRISADSHEARQFNMAEVDPSGNRRLDAVDIGFFEVVAFFDPQIVSLPSENRGKPGATQTYRLEGTNGSNVPDDIGIAIAFADSNQAGCSLTTMGSIPDAPGPGCPYRTATTAIPGDAWTTVADVPAVFESVPPLGVEVATLDVVPPGDWAGMEDATYQFIVTVESQADPGEPPATSTTVGALTVEATTESRTRYIGLEIEEMVGVLEQAKLDGVAVGGLLPLYLHAIRLTNERALERTLAGDVDGATRIHATNVRIVEGALRILSGGTGSSLPEALLADLVARAEAMRADMLRSSETPIASGRGA